jgi:soluble lytic murein transglycosylase-like protein
MKRRILLTAALLAASVSHHGTAEAATGRCAAYEPLLVQLAPRRGWDVARMSRYMWRESRCTPHVRSRTRDTGLLQINDINHAYLSRKMGKPITVEALRDPATNIQAAALLCTFWRNAGRSCYQPWAL